MTFNIFSRHAVFRRQLDAYLDGELDARARVRLDAHMVGCERCSARLRELRAAKRMLAALPEPQTSRSFRLTPAMVASTQPAFGPERRPVAGYVMRAAQLSAAAFALAFGVVVALDVSGGDGGRQASNERTSAPASALEDSAAPHAAGEAASGSAPEAQPTPGENQFNTTAVPTLPSFDSGGAGGQSLRTVTPAGVPRTGDDDTGDTNKATADELTDDDDFTSGGDIAEPALLSDDNASDEGGDYRVAEFAFAGLVMAALAAWASIAFQRRRSHS